MWQSKYLPTPIVQIVPGEYPPFAPVVGTNNRGIPGVCPDVGVGKYPGNTPFLGYPPGIPPLRSGRNRFQIPRVRPGVFPGYSPGTICTMGVGRYFDCHIMWSQKSQVTGSPRADWSKHIDMSYPRVMRCVGYPITSFLRGSQVILCTGTAFKYASAVTESRLAFHGAKERFDWLIVSQQGNSPIDLVITSRTDKSPLFARPRKESYRFDPPPKSARFLPRQMTGYFFPGFGV